MSTLLEIQRIPQVSDSPYAPRGLPMRRVAVRCGHPEHSAATYLTVWNSIMDVIVLVPSDDGWMQWHLRGMMVLREPTDEFPGTVMVKPSLGDFHTHLPSCGLGRHFLPFRWSDAL